MSTLLKDIRYSFRSLLKHPGFTAIVVATLAVGIAANTTIFSAVDALLVHPFSFPNQERLLVLWEQNPAVGTIRGSVAPGNFTDWREQNQTCEQLVAIDQLSFDLSDGTNPERFAGYGVTQGFFEALGVKAARGRTFLPEESESGREQVVVLKHSFWQDRFGGDPNIVGKLVTLNRKPFTVVGVMPADFNYPYNAGVMWTPLVFDREQQHDRQSHYLRIIGLLKPGATIDQAQAELHAIAKREQQEFPDTNTGRDVGVVTLTDDAVRGARTGVPILMGAVVFVLLIACANVANLLLVRAVSRHRETAVRLALGASRVRLIRQALTESAILGLLGGSIGLFISVWAIEALARGIPEDFSKFIPGWNRLGLNLNVLIFTFLVSMLAGMVAALAPIWHSSRTNLNEALKSGGRGDAGRAGHSRLRSILVVSEVALSLVLLISAGLMVRSFIAMQHADLGIKPENVLAMQVSLPRESYEDKNKRLNFYQQLLSRVETMPGVMNAGIINIVPFSSSYTSRNFQIVGQPPLAKGKEPYVEIRVTTPGYFDAIGTSLRGGRLFTSQDDANAARVILVNEEFSRRFLPGQQALGQRLELDGDPKEIHEIIGVVADVKNDDLDEAPDPAAYLPYSQNPYLTMNVVIRVTQDPTGMVAAVRSEVSTLEPGLPVSNVKTVNQMIYERVSPKRLMTYILAVFALCALLLASVGIYGVMSYSVSQRTQEIGIRMALGARATDVLKLVVSNGMKLTVIGVAIGLAGAFGLTRLLANLLFHVTPTDSLTFAGVAASLIAVALLASYIPARRATKVDPLVALRDE
jgi:putative ABC transport system permease protein